MESLILLSICMAPVVGLALVAVWPLRTALLATIVLLSLVLPEVRYNVLGLYDYDKGWTISAVAFLIAVVADPERAAAFRFRWIDLPVIVLCFAPLTASLTNGLGLYDGASGSGAQIMQWLVPYLLARIYLADTAGVKALAIAFFVAGLVYLLPCIFELRMSPQLHKLIYGDHQHSFGQTRRFGGWRPTVFLQHGLMVAMLMTVSSISGVWLWFSGVLSRVGRVPMSILLVPLLIVAVLCKSLGAILLLAVGLIVLFMGSILRTRLPLILLAVLPLVYVGLRASEVWNGVDLVEAATVVSEDRAESLQARLKNENMLVEKALQQPWFGWGGWSRSRVFDPITGRDRSVTDGKWIIALGQTGLFGLCAWLATLMLPIQLFLKAHSPRDWTNPEVAPAAVLTVILLLFLIDSIPNDMYMPMYGLIIGALNGLALQPWTQTSEATAAFRTRHAAASVQSRSLWPANSAKPGQQLLEH